ncbi:MAG: diguanylate cyclase, partial [Oscillospiraceae bacterium]|nr:diguanylate cyclase [Oscillospiraceae bacterium]
NSHINELAGFANIDGLTGAYNHRFFYQSLKKLCNDSENTDFPLSLIIMDMDYFKIYNDMYGHQQGDVALKELANILREFLPSDAIISRYGGDEFTVILNNTDIDKAREIANNLRKFVCEHSFFGEEHLPGEAFTVSMGVSQFRYNKDTCTSFVKRADLALYRAKYLRRNSVQVYTSIFEEFNNIDEDSNKMKETLKSLKSLITVINSRDSYTFSHTDRVVMLCMEVADYMELSKKDKKRLCYAAYLHDLGKINIPKEVLISEEKLTPSEWEELKRHPAESADIISRVDGLEDIVPIVLQHHERYDGKGYPNNVKGEEINYLARILTLADSFDAMTNTRPYQPTKNYAQAFKEIEACSGTQFDPQLSRIFIEAVKTKYDANLLSIR